MNYSIFIPLKGMGLVRIDSRNICFIEADDHYPKVITIDACYRSTRTLTQLEAILPADLFCRVHRSYIIQMFHITAINGDIIRIKDRDIPLAKQYRDILQSRIIVL